MYVKNDEPIVEFKYYFEPIYLLSREYRVLKYLIEHNLNYNQIANILKTTASRIKNIIQEICDKLEVYTTEYRNINLIRSLFKYVFLPENTK